MDDTPPTTVVLRAGDIISVGAPGDPVLNGNTFLVVAASSSNLSLRGRGGVEVDVPLDDGETTISSITILSRGDPPRFSDTIGAVEGKQIKIFLDGGDSVVGKVIARDNDAITIQPEDGGEPFTLDFAYTGVPGGMGIDRIEVQPDIPIQPAVTPVRDDVTRQLEEMVFDADELRLGEVLDDVTEVVDVPENQRRFGLSAQLDELQDELLAAVPSDQRTDRKLGQIHSIVQRFKELREEYSLSDGRGVATYRPLRGSNYRPQLDGIANLSAVPGWLNPVISQLKYAYGADVEPGEEAALMLLPTTLEKRQDAYERALGRYESGAGIPGVSTFASYARETASIDRSALPAPQGLALVPAASRIEMITESGGDLVTTAVGPGGRPTEVNAFRHVALPPTYIYQAERGSDGDLVVKGVEAALGEEVQLTGLATVPYGRAVRKYAEHLGPGMIKRCASSFGKPLKDSGLRRTTLAPTEPSLPTCVLSRPLYVRPEVGAEGQNEWKSLIEKVTPTASYLLAALANRLPLPLSVAECMGWLAPYGFDARNIDYDAQVLMEALTAKGLEKALSGPDREPPVLAPEPIKAPSPLDLLPTRQLRQIVQLGYGMDPDLCSSGECSTSQWQLMCAIDEGRLYAAALAYSNADLLMADGAVKLQEIESWIESPLPKTKDRCTGLVLAKRYIATEEVPNPQAEEGNEAFFDAELDPTPYGLRIGSSEGSLEAFLQQSLRISREEAIRHAEAIKRGKRVVVDGEKAEVKRTDGSVDVFSWQKGKWRKDSRTEASESDTALTLCNASAECVEVPGPACLSIGKAAISAAKENAKASIDNLAALFDVEVLKAKKQAKSEGEVLLSVAADRVRILRALRRAKLRKPTTVSPTPTGSITDEERIRNSILGLGDLPSRLTAIHRFIELLTRPHLPDSDESEYWLYGLDSGRKLMPSFYATLARVFLSGGDYDAAIREICAARGTLSDDGDAWVDKHSGYVIVAISFDTDEGYTEQGFKQTTRSILARDLNIDVKTDDTAYASPEAKAMSLMAKGIGFSLGVNLAPQLDTIVAQSLQAHAKLVPSKERFQKMVKEAQARGKKRKDSYESVVAQSMVISVGVFALLTLQTSLPPISIRRRIPGCSVELNGYPIGPKDDDRSISFIACVLSSLKGSGGGWVGLRGLSRGGLERRITSVMEKIALKDPAIQGAIAARRRYNEEHSDELPVSVQSVDWPTFLPPLRPLEVDGISLPTDAMKKSLMKSLKDGSNSQFESLARISGRIAYLALEYSQRIRQIVGTEEAYLRTADETPFLENSCCSDGPTMPLAYFSGKAQKLLEINDSVDALTSVISVVAQMARASMLYDPKDTKRQYPNPPAGFAKATVYAAYIHYCRWGTNLATPDLITEVCGPRPEALNLNASIADQIEQLEAQGRSISSAQLNKLLSVVNARNEVKLNLYAAAPSNVQRTRDLLRKMDDESMPTLFPRVAVQKMEGAIDTFSAGEDSSRDLRNYLASANESMFNSLVEAFDRADGVRLGASERRCLATLTGEACKRYVRSISMVLPEIVLHDVRFDGVKPPRHWNLSSVHARDYAQIVKRYYDPLRKLYGKPELEEPLRAWTEKAASVQALLETVPTSGSLMGNRAADLFARYCLLLCLSTLQEAFKGLRSRQLVPGDESMMVRGEEGVTASFAFLSVICASAGNLQMDLEEIKEKVNRSKEKEKDGITSFLKNMTDEEREIENLFKNNKLGRWSMGLQKGVSQYDPKTYDAERDAMDEVALAEMREGTADMVSELTRDVFSMDRLEQIAEEERAEAEAYDMSSLPEDDDYGDEDGDQ